MKQLISIIIVFVFSLSLIAGCSGDTNGEESVSSETTAPVSGTVATSGSTSMEKVIASLIEAFVAKNPEVTITYDATGSGAGIAAVAEGIADIGLSSRDLKASETDLEATVIALDGIAIIVNNANNVENLTIEEIARIFSGEITNWSEVGGADAPVAVIGREAGSGTRDGFETIVGVTERCVYDQELTSTGAVIAAVASNTYSIGYASLSAVGSETKTLTVEGVDCTEATVLDGTYTIQRPFIMVTASDNELSDAARAFIEYALSGEAAEIISNAGAIQPQ